MSRSEKASIPVLKNDYLNTELKKGGIIFLILKISKKISHLVEDPHISQQLLHLAALRWL